MIADEQGKAWPPSPPTVSDFRDGEGFKVTASFPGSLDLHRGLLIQGSLDIGLGPIRRVRLVLGSHCLQLQNELWKGSEVQSLRPHPRPPESKSAFAQDVPRIPVHSRLTGAALEQQF